MFAIATVATTESTNNLQGVAKQNSPVKFFAVFSAIVWSFNLIFCVFIF